MTADTPPRDDAGFSLVEVVVAMSIFVVLTVAVLAVLVTSLGGVRSNAQRVQAANLAAQQIEAVRSQRADDIPDGTVAGSASGTTIEATTYTVTQTANFYASDQKQSICDSSSDTPAFKRVSVVVTWPDMGSVKPVRSTTVVSVGLGDAKLTTGLVAVSVLDSTPAPVKGLAVALTNGLTSTTDDQGCAVFTNVPVGGYYAVLDTSGYVGTNGQQRYTSSALLEVKPSRISRDTVEYDKSGRLSVAWSYPAGYVLPEGAGMSATLQYSLADPAGPRPAVACGPAGAAVGQHCFSGPRTGPRTLSPLYPATYQVSAGLCEVPRPASSGVNLVRGGNQTVTVPLASIKFSLTGGNAAFVGSGVTLSNAKEPSCKEPSYYFGTVPEGGQLGISLPAGSWTLKFTQVNRQGRDFTVSSPFTLEAGKTVNIP